MIKLAALWTQAQNQMDTHLTIKEVRDKIQPGL
jgi:hypothetical protein